MFISKKYKESRRAELERAILMWENELKENEQLLEDIKNNYLPLREKCREIIISYNLNYFPLCNVLGVAYEDEELRVIVNNVKWSFWDGERTILTGETLLDETIQIRGLRLDRHEADLIRKLEDPTNYIALIISRNKESIKIRKELLNELKEKEK